ncbi:MAG: hypothetical protein U9N45_08105, partial [Gemmatimonadota bacterium]|nr:hypothetical protein [Gemmatimonadota bacterium]
MREKKIDRRDFLNKLGIGGLSLSLGSLACGKGGGTSGSGPAPGEGTSEPAAEKEACMTVAELMEMPKIDAHAHINTSTLNQVLSRGTKAEDLAPLIDILKKHNMRWKTISTRSMNWEFLKSRIEAAVKMHERYPEWISWDTSFHVENWGRPEWEKTALANIEDGFSKGAVGVKVWKDLGMVLKDRDGSFVMIDDPRFDPIFDYVEACGKTLVGHIGEPLNCWLPLEEMTVNNDRRYFAEHTRYHAYL